MERNDTAGAECTFRLTQVGCRVFIPHMSKRRVTITASDLHALISKAPGSLLPMTAFTPEVQSIFQSTSIGSMVCTFPTTMAPLHVAVWRGRTTINAMTNKLDMVTLTSTLTSEGFVAPLEVIKSGEALPTIKSEETSEAIDVKETTNQDTELVKDLIESKESTELVLEP